MKLQKKLLQGLLFLSIVNIVYANKFVLRNDTRYTMSILPVYKGRHNVLITHSAQDIYPGKEEILAQNHDELAGIIVTDQGAWKKIDRNDLLKKYFFPLDFSQPDGANYKELDTLQHRAIWDKTFPIRYGLIAGWSVYYLQPLTPYQ